MPAGDRELFEHPGELGIQVLAQGREAVRGGRGGFGQALGLVARRGLDLARLAFDLFGDIAQRRRLVLQNGLDALGGGGRLGGRRRQVARLRAQSLAHRSDTFARPFGRIDQRVQPVFQHAAGIGEPATESEMEQNQPQKRERREDAGQEDAELVRQHEQQVLEADLIDDITMDSEQP